MCWVTSKRTRGVGLNVAPVAQHRKASSFREVAMSRSRLPGAIIVITALALMIATLLVAASPQNKGVGVKQSGLVGRERRQA
jgi:hypothetical protein